MPLTLRALVVVGVAVAAALLGRAALCRFVQREQVEGAERTADLSMEAMAGLYGVLLAFLLAGAWERSARTLDTVRLEADAVADLGRLARYLPVPLARELTSAADSYRAIAQEEVRRSGAAPSSGDADAIVDGVWRTLAHFEPGSTAEAEVQSRALDAVQELASQRWNRLSARGPGVPSILWIVLIGGAAGVLLMASVANPGSRLAAVYLSLLTAVIAFALYGLYALSNRAPEGTAIEMQMLLFSTLDVAR